MDELLSPVRWRGYPMPFTPSWLPDGFNITQRRVTTGRPGPQRREWHLNPLHLHPRVQLELKLGGPSPWPSASTVDINGTPGWVSHSKYSASCSWQPFEGIEMRVSVAGEPDEPDTDRGAQFAETVVRIARSTGVGHVEYLRPTMSFGWLPGQVPLRLAFERHDRPDGSGEMASAFISGESRRVIFAGVFDRLDDSIRLEEAQKTTLRGRPAWYVPPDPQTETQGPGTFVVELADGRWLFAATDPAEGGPVVTKDDLSRIVETCRLD
ncbi:hypothetical protein [Allorhizocola rhizosphaerae]|uniref:hypothetical protein n=1 Tax=Allorhizocola rhizosphaerae TaxID=1872709 RepID=UPI0013C2EC11|nr:hypothetical protein [Allorhizocola rhizosphaerae]